MSDGFRWEPLGRDGRARRGRLHTAHGTVETPAFMPVGTAGSVKGMMPESVSATGAEMVLGNTYHLMLRPGAERVAKLGGLHRMMDWAGPILTDSGGFQVMSLADLRRIDEDGVTFKSHIDGSRHHLGPESSTEIQHLLDATVTMAFDECPAWPIEHAGAETSMEMSMRWAARCREAFVSRPGYGQFGIVQGAIFPDLRERSVAALSGIGFEGYAIGGLAVGEGPELMLRTLETTEVMMPDDKPRYLMGVGRPSDLVEAVRRGVDMFDCVMPTRSGRMAQGFTRRGKVNLRNRRHQEDPRPVDDTCTCPACTRFSRAYLHHLLKANEMLGPMLLTWHNVHYYQTVMRELRAAIEAGRLEDHAAAFHAEEAKGDIPPLD